MTDIQGLKLAEEHFAAVDDRSKRATIRQGVREIRPGPMMLISATDETKTRLVNVTRVAFTLVGNLTARDAYVEDAPNVIALYEALRAYYTDLNHNSLVTVVEFELIEKGDEQ